MELAEIIKLIHVISESTIDVFHYSTQDSNLILEKKEHSISNPYVAQDTAPTCELVGALNEEIFNFHEKEEFIIKSPIVGTFYASKSEDGIPFIQIGDCIKKGQVIGIVEAMKLMNEIQADCDGIVTDIYVQNQQIVEYNQKLVCVRPF